MKNKMKKPKKLPALKIHPVAVLFPMMGRDELQELAADIKQNGLIQPVILDSEGQVIDGRCRLKACKIAGVRPRFEKLDSKADLKAFIVSANLQRRNLTKGQRALLLAMIYPEPARARDGSGSADCGCELSSCTIRAQFEKGASRGAP